MNQNKGQHFKIAYFQFDAYVSKPLYKNKLNLLTEQAKNSTILMTNIC